MSIGSWNAVRGCAGWFYSLRVLSEGKGEPTVEFYVYHGTESVGPLVASVYRTTALARRLGVKPPLRGYQHEAQVAIRARATPNGRSTP